MLLEILALKELNKPVEIPQPKPVQTVQVEPKPKPKPKPKSYVIKRGDTLNKLSKRFRVPVRRLVCANHSITDPDLIEAGDRLKIPSRKAKLKCAIVKTGENHRSIMTRKPSKSGGFSSSNTYEPGQCTWHVKNLAPWVPNNWGNATDWLANARASGFNTGSVARKGAVGWTSGHVVFIVAVRGSKVLIDEMNYNWTPYAQRQIWKPASTYQYIY